MGSFANYSKLFPIDEMGFEVDGNRWVATLTNKPDGSNGDALCYCLEFYRSGFPSNVRELRLWVSEVGLHHGGRYVAELLEKIQNWLETDQLGGELAYYG